MSYVDRAAARPRAGTALAIAALHAGAFYALVVGLAAHGVPEILTTTTGYNIPNTPPPSPQPQPSARPRRPLAQTHETFVDPLPHAPSTFGPLSGSAALPTGNESEQFELTLPPLPPVPTTSASPLYAATRAVPQGNAANWVTTDDYPARDLREGNAGKTGYRLTIGSDGRVQSCVTILSSGHAGLDSATCRLLQQRARFRPATGPDGAATTGTYSGTVAWVIPPN